MKIIRKGPDALQRDRFGYFNLMNLSLVFLSPYCYVEQSQETMQQDHLKLEETCVMVTGDELQLIPKGAAGNLKTNKVHTVHCTPLLPTEKKMLFI